MNTTLINAMLMGAQDSVVKSTKIYTYDRRRNIIVCNEMNYFRVVNLPSEKMYALFYILGYTKAVSC